MDIANVRLKFQKPWDVTSPTNTNIKYLIMDYSLQQEAIGSGSMLLYITADNQPDLVGHLLDIHGQLWIVHKRMKETVNTNLYEYHLYQALDTVTMEPVVLAKNALGVVNTTDKIDGIILNCFVEEASAKEKTVPTAQPGEAFQQSFIVASKQFIDAHEAFTINYRGYKYRYDSIEPSEGVYIIRATKEL